MSLKRMNAEERASYLIGQAVLRQFEGAPRDPETMREISAICRWIEHWLTADEYDHVVVTTGYDFAGRYFDFDPRPPSSDNGGGDIPF